MLCEHRGVQGHSAGGEQGSVGARSVAYVLGGGGRLGAAEVGMLEALDEVGIVPATIHGPSIGAVNGAAVAADPTTDGIARLRSMWQNLDRSGVFGARLVDRVRHVARTRTSLHSNDALRRLLEAALPATFEKLRIRFECVAACVETAHESWFDEGDLVSAVLASCAVPGLLPPVERDGAHHLDGGIIDSIPIRRAIDAGANTVFVLQVGRIEEPLRPPRWPHEVAMVAFEIARRHSFASAMARVGEDIEVHVLPTGGQGPAFTDVRQLRYRDFSDVGERIDRAHEATAAYLEMHSLNGKNLH